MGGIERRQISANEAWGVLWEGITGVVVGGDFVIGEYHGKLLFGKICMWNNTRHDYV